MKRLALGPFCCLLIAAAPAVSMGRAALHAAEHQFASSHDHDHDHIDSNVPHHDHNHDGSSVPADETTTAMRVSGATAGSRLQLEPSAALPAVLLQVILPELSTAPPVTLAASALPARPPTRGDTLPLLI